MDDFSGVIHPVAINDMRLEEEEEETVEESFITEEENSVREEEGLSFKEEVPEEVEEQTHSSRVVPSTQTSAQDSTDSSAPSIESRSSLEDYQMPQINYSRDVPGQYLVAVIGREFDEPSAVSVQLQQRAPRDKDNVSIIKFVPYSVKRSTLTKYNTEWSRIGHYDVVCMCYNASEARLLLTGPDGFYTQLLKQVERLLGPNRVCFVITRHASSLVAVGNQLLSPQLKQILGAQSSLGHYLSSNQVLSWTKEPHSDHVTRLIEIAKTDLNPNTMCLML